VEVSHGLIRSERTLTENFYIKPEKLAHLFKPNQSKLERWEVQQGQVLSSRTGKELFNAETLRFTSNAPDNVAHIICPQQGTSVV
jgi:hypothetical protein